VVSTSSSTRLQCVTERVQGARPRLTHLPLRSVNSFSMAARADVFGTWESSSVGLRDGLGVGVQLKGEGGLDSLSYLDWSEFPQKQQ
jgi:hypothetical protein